jgi:hypothetical protein
MDTTAIVVIAILALIVVAAFVVFRQRTSVRIKGPLGSGLELDASNNPPRITPGVKIEGAKSRSGGLLAEDKTGRGAEVNQVDVKDDILVTSAPPGENLDPKA